MDANWTHVDIVDGRGNVLVTVLAPVEDPTRVWLP